MITCELQEDNQLVDRILSTMLLEKPTTKFSDVCGMDTVIENLQLALIVPIRQPQLLSSRPYRSCLFYGPPGTGKSLLAESVAGEIKNASFFFVSSSDLISKYQGVSEALVRNLFKVARMKKPSIIIFINEIDCFALARKDTDDDSSRRIKTELLVQMDTITGISDGIFVMAATNTPKSLDDAFLRRFDKLIYVALPNFEARYKMFKQRFSNIKFYTFSEKNLTELASRTDGLSGADTERLCQEANVLPAKRTPKSNFFKRSIADNGKVLFIQCNECDEGAVKMNWQDIPPGCINVQPMTTMEDALASLKSMKPSVNSESIEEMETFSRERGEFPKPLSVPEYEYNSPSFFDYFWSCIDASF